MHKVLILTAGFGNGHNAAAYNLRDGLETVSEDVQVEVLDLFKACYGWTNDLVARLYLNLVDWMPGVWSRLYDMLDRTSLLESQMSHMPRLRHMLQDLLTKAEPDAVVCTHPAYNYVIDQIYRDHSTRPFTQFTVITDSISINSVWHAAHSDYYLVANELSAQALARAGVPNQKIRNLGFPVSPRFEILAKSRNGNPVRAERRILYVINTGKKKAGRIIDQILELPNVQLTITCGADPTLRTRLEERTKPARDRVRVLGWTSEMPEILCASDLVITKAGGAMVQEALAAGTPMIVNQVIPGQEEGNARLVEALGVGAVASDDDAVLAAICDAFDEQDGRWSIWKRAVVSHGRPGAALAIARFILDTYNSDGAGSPSEAACFKAQPHAPSSGAAASPAHSKKRPLLCDFHTHTNYSDGKLTVAELVDFYGSRGFDCLCITDHLAEKGRFVGRLANLSNLTLPWHQIDEYFGVIERQKKRAWRKYGMVLMAGLEFNKDGLSKKSSTHLLGIDLKGPINPDLELKTLIRAVRAQGALAVASHPHEMKSVWGKNTLYLWENQDEFAPLLDAWEIANRNDIFNPVGLKRLPFLANSDFHKPKHIYSWKTLLNCEKHPEAIKQCIRANRDISITLYREPVTAQPLPEEGDPLDWLGGPEGPALQVA